MGPVAKALETGIYNGATGGAKITAAARADYAEAAAVVMLASERKGQIYELTGDTPFTLFDLCAEITRQSGCEVSYHDMKPEAYADVLKKDGMPSGIADFMAHIDAALAQGALCGDSGDLPRLIGRPTTPIRDVIAWQLAGCQGKRANR